MDSSMGITVKPSLEIILKVTEVCNLNCSYCYFFNGPDDSFKFHPKQMSTDTARAISSYVRRAAESGEIGSALFMLHGGEPMMLGRRRFGDLLQALDVRALPLPTAVALQTNGTLIDDAWVDLFSEAGIDVALSIDGPPEYHDACRVDHRGRGTHSRTAAGVERLRRAHRSGRIGAPGVICVIDPERDPRRVYRHLVDDLGFRSLAFVLPDGDWSTIDAGSVRRVGDYLIEVLDTWLEDDDPGIAVRLFSDMLAFARSGSPAGRTRSSIVIGVSSDGSVAPDDGFRMSMPEVFSPSQASLTVRNSELGDFLGRYGDGPVPGLGGSDPEACRSCRWASHCRSGEPSHRFARQEGRWRESVYCEALKRVYGRLADYMLANGVAGETIEAAFPLKEAA
ncbi:MAG TPA: radical SAM protein [Allosphingosinicella sp.]|nr:radical SAM protein [Allosphingosinicella sp.]